MKQDTADRIRLREYLSYGIGGAGSRLIFGVIGAYYLIYLTNVAMLDVAVISTILAVSRLLDGISDLIVGDIIDNTSSKYGRARVWLLRMCLPFAISSVLLFWVPPQFSEFVKYIYVFLIYNIVNSVMMTFVFISEFSLVSLMSGDSREQGILGNIVGLAHMGGSMCANVVFVRLLMLFTDEPGNQNTQRAYTLSVSLIAAVMVVLTLLMVFGTRERVDADTVGAGRDKNRRGFKDMLQVFRLILSDKYWVIFTIIMLLRSVVAQFYMSGPSYYALYILHDMSAMSWLITCNMLPSIIVMSITPFLMSRINKYRMFTAGIVLNIIGTASLGLSGDRIPLIVMSLIICSTGGGLFGCVNYGIIADIVTHTKERTGVLIPGAGNAGASAAGKLGSGLGNVIFGFGLAAAGFNAALDTQPDSVLSMIRMLYMWAPCVCFILSLVLFVGFFDMYKKRPAKSGSQDQQ